MSTTKKIQPKRKAAAKRKASATKAKRKTATTKAKPKKAGGDKKPKRLSALDAAAEVLKNAGRPMHCRELITAMAEQGLWRSPKGATPHATLYAAILREARNKGNASRFKKVDRGRFAFSGQAK